MKYEFVAMVRQVPIDGMQPYDKGDAKGYCQGPKHDVSKHVTTMMDIMKLWEYIDDGMEGDQNTRKLMNSK